MQLPTPSGVLTVAHGCRRISPRGLREVRLRTGPSIGSVHGFHGPTEAPAEARPDGVVRQRGRRASAAVLRLRPRAVMPPLWRELGGLSQLHRPPVPIPALGPLSTSAPASILLIPGFLAGDASMRTLATYLRAAGQHPHAAGISRNVQCSEITIGRLLERVEAVAERDGRRVCIIGHSRGGLF